MTAFITMPGIRVLGGWEGDRVSVWPTEFWNIFLTAINDAITDNKNIVYHLV